MRKVLLGMMALLALALGACGGETQTKTVTVNSAATATTDATQAPAPKPTVEISWNSPQVTTRDQATLRGTVTNGAHVKVAGHRAAVVGTKWSKVVQIKKHGENVYHVTATRSGYDAGAADASVTRKLSAAEKAVIRQQQAVIRQQKAERRASMRALQAAENYLAFSGMSKKGLYEQLSSSAGEGFPAAQAQYAVDHVHADWNQEAVQAARAYLQIEPMSKSALIEQLSSSAGDGFTYAQAVYAANKVY